MCRWVFTYFLSLCNLIPLHCRLNYVNPEWNHLEGSWGIYRPHGMEIICLVASVCLIASLHLFGYALLSKSLDLWAWFLAWQLTLTLASLGLYVKVVGQRSGSMCFYTMHALQSGRYKHDKGTAWWVQQKLHDTRNIMCLSVIRGHLRSVLNSIQSINLK